jgi:hypothetical protein
VGGPKCRQHAYHADVDEFWICQHCRSLNRAGTGRCYHCKKKYGSKPKEVPGTIVKGSAAQAPLPLPRNAGFAGDPNAPYLSRPVTRDPANAVNPLGGTPKSGGGLHRPHPLDAIKSRIVRSLALRPSVSIGRLGYLSVGLLVLLLADGVLLVVTALPAAQRALEQGSVTDLPAQLSVAKVPAAAFLTLGLLSLVSFSLFMGLATHNAPGLGADTPFLSPYRAGTCWIKALWTQVRIALAFIVPVALVWMGYTIFGLIAALIAVEIAQRHLDDPFAWLTNPYRHVLDLYNKLGVQGASSSWMASLWSATFLVANVLAIVAYAVPLLVLLVLITAGLTNQPNVGGWQSSGLGPAQLGLVALAVGLLAFTTAMVGLLVPITVEIAHRERTRKTLVRVGRSRSWVARPGGLDAPQADEPTTTRYDPNDQTLDRTVERYPNRIPGRDPDQASLYSPSTTSSPWSPAGPEGPSD